MMTAWTTLAAAALTGWSTNWPAWEYQRQGRAQALDCYSGLVERATACAGSSPAAVSWWRSQRTLLAAYKGSLKGYIEAGFYLNHVGMTNGSSTYTGWLDSNWPAGTNVASMPLWTLTNVCATLRIPTNYWSYTPRRCLNGLGPNDWDAGAVGRNHGWTNALTAAGGPYLPSGRSAWYTTDYGWQPLHDAINLLLVAAESVDAYDWLAGQRKYLNSAATGATWADAAALAEAHWSTNATVSSEGGRPFIWSYGTFWTVYDPDYRCEPSRRWNALRYESAPVTIAHRARLFAYTAPPYAWAQYWTWDDNGDGFAENGWNEFGPTAWTNAASDSLAFGPTTLAYPDLCPEPSGSGLVRSYSGWQVWRGSDALSAEAVILEFAFDYK